MTGLGVIGAAESGALLRIERSVGERVPIVATRCWHTIDLFVGIDCHCVTAIGNKDPLHANNTFNLPQMVRLNVAMVSEFFFGDRTAAEVDARVCGYKFCKFEPFAGELCNLTAGLFKRLVQVCFFIGNP